MQQCLVAANNLGGDVGDPSVVILLVLKIGVIFAYLYVLLIILKIIVDINNQNRSITLIRFDFNRYASICHL